MQENKTKSTRTGSAIAELKAITDLLITRCCQHAADCGDMDNKLDDARMQVAERDTMIAELQAKIAAAAPKDSAEEQV